MKNIQCLPAMLFAGIILLCAAHASAGTTIILPFYTSGVEARQSADLGQELLKAGRERFGTSNLRSAGNVSAIEHFNPENSEHIRAAASAGRNADAEYVITGVIEKAYMGIQVKAALISVSRRETVYRTAYYSSSDNGPGIYASAIMGRIALRMKGADIGTIQNISAAPDDRKGKIRIAWDALNGAGSYTVYRSPFSEGPFEEIGRVKGEPAYEDASALRGLGYWYSVAPVIEGTGCDPRDTVETHLKSSMPKGLDVEAVKRAHKISDASLRREKAKSEVRRHLAFLEEYYMHPVKLTLVFLVAKSYLRNGTLIALNGFTKYTLDGEKREILMERDDNAFCVTLNANKFFRLIEAARQKNLPRQETLIDRLVYNGVAYVMYSGEKKVTDTVGHTIYMPCFDAFGMSTEYFKNYQGWKSTTAMFGTSNGALKKKMQEAQQRHNN